MLQLNCESRDESPPVWVGVLRVAYDKSFGD
jgi:hypothetical protein